MTECRICGEEDCKEHSMFIGKVRKIDSFSGSSPPEVFVGKWNYPNVYVGILSPEEYGNTKIMSSHEEWHSKKLEIQDVVNLRNKLIYGRTQNNIKKVLNANRFMSVLQEVAMTSKSVASQFVLKKPISRNDEKENRVPLISNAAPVESVKLEENPKIEKKVEYLVGDRDVKSKQALIELEKGGIDTSTMIKLLSAGLLGVGKNRKLVPTRWSITAVDSNLSEEKIDKIKYYSSISDYMVFHDEYVGNHYEILLIPRYWSFEVIEISLKNFGIWKDYETIFKRKKYAESVTGAYYANRLGVTEYLESIRRQATVLIFREIKPEYYAPLGVGILRETTRSAMKGEGKKFSNLKEALDDIQTRLRIPVGRYLKESSLMIEMQQRSLSDF
ncbi:MAG: hypothetical protein Q7S27_04995 [Nanoarchaeota archaeon]|nr:hypothetical protein [Nanoarchaeota archaeon]